MWLLSKGTLQSIPWSVSQLTSELLKLWGLWSFQKVTASTSVGVWTEWEIYDLHMNHSVTLSEPSNVSIASTFRRYLLILKDIWILLLQTAELHLEMWTDWGFSPRWGVTLLKAAGPRWHGNHTPKSSFEQTAEGNYPYVSLHRQVQLKTWAKFNERIWTAVKKHDLFKTEPELLRLTLDSLFPSLLPSPFFFGRQKRENWYG